MDSDQGKLFVGGISWETSEEALKEYFGAYGEVLTVVIMRDKATGRPRGFGFVVFADPSILDRVLQDKHTIDGRTVDAKRALSREEQQTSGRTGNQTSRSSGGGARSNRTKKIFVGGLPSTLSEEGFRRYFEQYGLVTDVVIMHDQTTHRPRGFGFVSFDSEDSVEKVSQITFHNLDGKLVEVKPAMPKELSSNSSGGRSTGGGSYQSYNASSGNTNSYDGRMETSRYMQPQTAAGGYPAYGSSAYGAPGYGYGGANNGVGYGGYGVGGYGNTTAGYSGPAYGTSNAPAAGYASGPPGGHRSPWGNQTSSGYGSVGYGGNAAYGTTSTWNPSAGSGGSGAAPTGQSPNTVTGYGNQGYGYGGYGGSEGLYGNQSGYGSAAGRGTGGSTTNPLGGSGEQGIISGYMGGRYGDADASSGYQNSWRSDPSQGGPYGTAQLNGGGYGGPQGRQAQQQ